MEENELHKLLKEVDLSGLPELEDEPPTLSPAGQRFFDFKRASEAIGFVPTRRQMDQLAAQVPVVDLITIVQMEYPCAECGSNTRDLLTEIEQKIHIDLVRLQSMTPDELKRRIGGAQ